jgi:SAM-dependent methyltransferase
MSERGLCLNIGCGKNAADGWINIDSSPYLRATELPVVGKLALRAVRNENELKSATYGDIVRGLKLQPGCCELVFASHILEHLSLPDFDTALSNIYSYLRPGGRLRIIVPDLTDYVDAYRKEREDPAASGQAAANFMELSGLGNVRSRKSLGDRWRDTLSNARHQWMWDQPSLIAALGRHGFENCRVCKYGEWGDGRFAAVEKEARHQRSICIEATK